MYDMLRNLIVDAFTVLLNSPRRAIPGDEMRRSQAKRMIELYEDFEAVLAACSRLRASAVYYVESDGSSLVAKRMRRRKIVHAAAQLEERLAELGDALFAQLHRLEGRTPRRDALNHLIGIRPLGRERLWGAPSVAPRVVIQGNDAGRESDASLLVYVATEAVLDSTYGPAELKHFFQGDRATFPFIKTVSLDDAGAARPMLESAGAAIEDLTGIYSRFREHIRATLTIDDLLA